MVATMRGDVKKATANHRRRIGGLLSAGERVQLAVSWLLGEQEQRT